MSYYIDANRVSLDDLQKRIKETDLIPSRCSLLEDIDEKFLIFKAHGFSTLEDVRHQVKNQKNIPALSQRIGIDQAYLTMLRREIEGYFPKTRPLSSFDWFQKKDLDKLECKGLHNTLLLYEALNTPQKREQIVIELGLDTVFVDSLFSLVDLTRIQWVSPIFARMLVSAGYTTVKSVSSANSDELCSELDRVNKENSYFKEKIGFKDVKRLVQAASYVS